MTTVNKPLFESPIFITQEEIDILIAAEVSSLLVDGKVEMTPTKERHNLENKKCLTYLAQL